jgi:hypothetical protein
MKTVGKSGTTTYRVRETGHKFRNPSFTTREECERWGRIWHMLSDSFDIFEMIDGKVVDIHYNIATR